MTIPETKNEFNGAGMTPDVLCLEVEQHAVCVFHQSVKSDKKTSWKCQDVMTCRLKPAVGRIFLASLSKNPIITFQHIVIQVLRGLYVSFYTYKRFFNCFLLPTCEQVVT